jgi:topoisomerase-4 subunit A
MAYLDGKTGRAMAKRFNVTAITRDREYDLTKKTKSSKVLYFSANPNGEAETITVQLSGSTKAQQKNFDFDFAELAIKGRGAAGNIMTRYPVRKVTLKEVGKSTLGAMKVWMDEVSGRLNLDGRGQFLGGFDTGDYLLAVYQDGSYEREELDLTRRYDPNNLYFIGKWEEDMVISAVYYEGERGTTLVKRFNIETSSPGQAFNYLSDHKQTKLYIASVHPRPEIQYAYREKRQKVEKTVVLSDFIDIKGWKALGNKLHDGKLIAVKELNDPFVPIDNEEAKVEATPVKKAKSNGTAATNGKLKPGSTIELDF